MIVFEKPGKDNTAETVRIAVQAAKERGIRHLVIASSQGNSVKLITDADDLNVAVVTLQAGSREPNVQVMPPEVRSELEAKGWHVVCAAHALSGAERAISRKFGGVYPVEIIAASLRMLSQGTKVAVEVATMAADAGYIPVGEPIIAIGGSGRGSDTALILHAANSNNILDTNIQEILCKPYI